MLVSGSALHSQTAPKAVECPVAVSCCRPLAADAQQGTSTVGPLMPARRSPFTFKFHFCLHDQSHVFAATAQPFRKQQKRMASSEVQLRVISASTGAESLVAVQVGGP